MSKALVIVMAKNPSKGKVKTRLAADIGDAKALEVYLHLMKKTATEVESSGIDCAVFYTESTNDEVFSPDHAELQTDGSLGERMKAAFKWSFDNGFDRCVMIGTDCFDLEGADLQQAAEALEDHDLVLGPANDGGYYLIGMKRIYDEVFDGIPWSTDEVYSITMERAKQSQLKVKSMRQLTDVDTVADLRSVAEKMSIELTRSI